MICTQDFNQKLEFELKCLSFNAKIKFFSEIKIFFLMKRSTMISDFLHLIALHSFDEKTTKIDLICKKRNFQFYFVT